MKEETQQSIGKILDETARYRDAIHIAVVPVVVAGNRALWPGDRVRLAYGTRNQVVPADREGSVGIIDPFLTGGVECGQRCWLFLHPNTVTGMRHEWVHPAFDSPRRPPANEAEAWLRKFADEWNFDYDAMVFAAQESDGYVVAQGIDLHGADELDPGDEDEFWRCIEAVTGRGFGPEHRQNFTWSCNC